MNLNNILYNPTHNKLTSSLLILITFLMSGCGGGDGTGSKAGQLTPVSIFITPATGSTVAKGQTTQFTAIAIYPDNSTANITNQVSWASGNNGVATIDKNTGVTTGISVGNATISATATGVSPASASLTVTSAVITGLTVTPSTQSTPKGVPITYTATAAYSDNSSGNVSGSVVWTTSDNTIAILNGSGIASTLNVGSADITAKANGVTSNTATLSVTFPTLTGIAITPSNSTVALGLTTNFIATGAYTDSTKVDLTNQVAWAPSSTSTASINNMGVATGLAVGNTTIFASFPGATQATASLTVNSKSIVGITISPAIQSKPQGESVAYTATAAYSDSSSGNVSGSVTWASSNNSVTTLNSSGLASTLGQGNATITASLMNITSNTASLTVTAPTLPMVTITSPLTNTWIRNTTNISASISSLVGIKLTELFVNGVPVASTTTNSLSPVFTLDTKTFTDDAKNLAVRVTDIANQVVDSTITVLKVDNTPPSTTMTHTVVGGARGSQIDFTFTGTATDNYSGVISVVSNGITYGTTGGSWSFASRLSSLNILIDYKVPLTITDAAGNCSIYSYAPVGYVLTLESVCP